MKKIKKLLIITLILIAAVGCSKKENKMDNKYLSGKINVLMQVKDYGDVKIELDADTAPITVTNFVKLVKNKFYDGLTFHRIMDGFMIQGGDPNGDGTGGSDETIKGEFEANGVKNNISHKHTFLFFEIPSRFT